MNSQEYSASGRLKLQIRLSVHRAAAVGALDWRSLAAARRQVRAVDNPFGPRRCHLPENLLERRFLRQSAGG